MSEPNETDAPPAGPPTRGVDAICCHCGEGAQLRARTSPRGHHCESQSVSHVSSLSVASMTWYRYPEGERRMEASPLPMHPPVPQGTSQGAQSAALKITSPGSPPPSTLQATKSGVRATPRAARLRA